MSTNYYDAENNKLIPIAGKGDFPADYGTKDEFESKKDSLPDGTVFTTTDEFVEGGGGSDDYSTEEKVIGRWINGKPIYRRVIKTNIGVATEFRTINLNFSFEDIVSAFITIKDSGNNIYPVINETRSIGGSMYNIGFFTGGNGYRLINSTAGTLQIVMEYTKTTDD